jgi:hypothetical protein
VTSNTTSKLHGTEPTILATGQHTAPSLPLNNTVHRVHYSCHLTHCTQPITLRLSLNAQIDTPFFVQQANSLYTEAHSGPVVNVYPCQKSACYIFASVFSSQTVCGLRMFSKNLVFNSGLKRRNRPICTIEYVFFYYCTVHFDNIKILSPTNAPFY